MHERGTACGSGWDLEALRPRCVGHVDMGAGFPHRRRRSCGQADPVESLRGLTGESRGGRVTRRPAAPLALARFSVAGVPGRLPHAGRGGRRADVRGAEAAHRDREGRAQGPGHHAPRRSHEVRLVLLGLARPLRTGCTPPGRSRRRAGARPGQRDASFRRSCSLREAGLLLSETLAYTSRLSGASEQSIAAMPAAGLASRDRCPCRCVSQVLSLLCLDRRWDRRLPLWIMPTNTWCLFAALSTARASTWCRQRWSASPGGAPRSSSPTASRPSGAWRITSASSTAGRRVPSFVVLPTHRLID